MNHILAPLALAAALLFPAAATAADTDEPTPRITVTGEGSVDVAPDMAILSLTVLREAETARQALDANNEAMAAVTAAMKEAGISERDLQTSGFTISPRYSYPDQKSGGDQQPKIIGYQVANTLSVRVRDLSKLGSVLDKSVTLGVNQGGDIAFTNDDPTAALAEARRKAMQDALARARTLTEAAGISVGRILDITEQSYLPQPPIPLGRMKMAMEASDAVPVQAGENNYKVHVNVSFELKQ